MSDNFLQQIQATEAQAQKMIENANNKSIKDIEVKRKQLEKERLSISETKKTEAKKTILAKQAEMKKTYISTIEKNNKEIEIQKRQLTEKQEKVLSTAYLYFLNDLI